MTACRHGDHPVSPNTNLHVQRFSAYILCRGLAIAAGMLVLLGCTLDMPQATPNVGRSPVIVATEIPELTTAVEVTELPSTTAEPPSATTVSPTAPPTETPEATATEEPTATAAPTRTAPPTRTPDPELAGMGYCRTEFGPRDS